MRSSGSILVEPPWWSWTWCQFFVTDNGHARGIVAPINGTASLLRRSGGTVAWVVPALGSPSPVNEEFYDPEVATRYGLSGGDGPAQDRLWHELDVEPEDLLVDKTASSAFFPDRCDLHELLVELGIDSVLIAGTVANVC